MNKAELIAAVAADTQMTKVQCEAVINATLKTIRLQLCKHAPVAIAGFGTFKVSSRAARQGRNPSTGEVIDIAATNGVSFKAGKTLKDAVN